MDYKKKLLAYLIPGVLVLILVFFIFSPFKILGGR